MILSAEQLIIQGRHVIEAWNAFAAHANGGCIACDAVANYWRRPGRQSNSLAIATHHQTLCDTGQPLFEKWRFHVDELKGGLRAQIEKPPAA